MCQWIHSIATDTKDEISYPLTCFVKGIWVNFYSNGTFDNHWGQIYNYTNTYCQVVNSGTPVCLFILGYSV